MPHNFRWNSRAESASPQPRGADTPEHPLDPADIHSWLRVQRRAFTAGEARTEEVRRRMRLMCAEAHQRQAHVEDLIVLLKQQWVLLPPETDGDGWTEADIGRRRAHLESMGDGRTALLDRMVRVLIEEFYRG